MKIAVIAPEVFPVPPIRGGAVETIIEEATRQMQGHEITILGIADPDLLPEETRENRTYLRYRKGPVARLLLSSWRLPFKKSSSPLYYWPYRAWLASRVKKLKPDVIWLHSRSHFAKALKRACPSARLILSLHNESNLKDAAVWSREYLNSCDRVTACSRSLAQQAAKRYPAVQPKLRILYNAADIDAYNPKESSAGDNERLRASLGFTAAQPIIGFAGRLVPEKGAHVLLEAFTRVREQVPGAGLCLIGANTFSDSTETPYIRELKEAALKHGGAVRFTGHVSRSRMPDYLRICDVFAFPSQWNEPFGMALVEAMACGLPAAAFDGGGPSEIIESESTGILVKKEARSLGLAEALVRLLKDKERARAMGAAARESVKRRFSWQSFAACFLALAAEPDMAKSGAVSKASAEGGPKFAAQSASLHEPVRPAANPQDPKAPAVLIAESGSGYGGTARYLQSLLAHLDLPGARILIAAYHKGPFIESLQRQGHEVYLRPSWRYPGPVERDGKTSGFAVLSRTIAHLFAIPGMALWLRSRKIKAVHLNNEILSHFPLVIAARLAGARTLCHLHGWRPLTRLEKMLVPFVTEFAAISNAGAEYYGAQIRKKPVSAVMNGISVNGGLTGLDEKRAALRSSLGIFENEKVFLLPARLMPWKGQDVFIRAFAKVIQKYPYVMGIIAGHDPSEGESYIRELRDRVKRAGLEKNLFFLPWQSDVWSLYAAADFVVHASKRPEPFGLVLLEAMAARKPVIATGAGGVMDIVVSGETGLLTPPGDDEALAAAMEFVLTRPDQAEKFAQAAEERLYRDFTMERNAREIGQIYHRLLSKKYRRVRAV